MATATPTPSSPPSRASQDDGGLWMRADLNTVADNANMTKDDSLTSGESSQEETTKVPPRAPTVVTRYFSMLEDENDDNDNDDVFILPPPPPWMASSPPTEGIAGAAEPSLEVTEGPGSVTEAKENPTGLVGHPGERQVETPQSEVAKASGRDRKAATSKESMDTASLSEEMDWTPSTEHGQAATEVVSVETGTGLTPSLTGQYDTAGRTAEDKESKGGSGDREERDRYLKQTPSKMEGGAGEETDYDTWQTERQMKEEELSTLSRGESEDLSLLTEDTDPDSDGTVKTNSNSKSPDPNTDPSAVNETDSSPFGPPEHCKCNTNSDVDTVTEEPRGPHSPAERSGDDQQQHVDRTPLNYNITMEQWVGRDSATIKVPLPHLPIFSDSLDHETGPPETQEGGEKEGEEERKRTERVGSWTVVTDMLLGEELLQRLQMLQQRQDVPQESEETPPSRQVVKEPTNQATGDWEAERGEFGTEGEDSGEGGRDPIGEEEEEQGADGFNTDEEDGEMAAQEEKEQREESGNEAAGEKAQASSSATAILPGHQRVTTRMEAVYSDDDQSDSRVSDDFSPINTPEIPQSQNPTLSTHHPPAIATEREVVRSVQRKQTKQRTRVVLNPKDIPDLLEIPFKTDTLPKTTPTRAGAAGQSYDWQFSEQKMQREISEEIQREQVLVQLGKIPGGYSKGTTRQLKETKMLFEAFQQGNIKGPTRNRRLPLSSMSFRGHVYPSVLERTRSLEMFSLKSLPVSRAHCLRPHKSKASVKPRCESSEGLRDGTRLYPYPKQDKHLRLCRSMDSLNLNVGDTTTSSEDTGVRRKGVYKKKDPAILKENPFFKLRPALALQPEVVRDIQEAREREEELRRQRCTLYGEIRTESVEEEEQDTAKKHTQSGARQQAKGKLDRIWPPPPSKIDLMNSGQTQESRGHKAGSLRASLWQRWEAGMVTENN